MRKDYKATFYVVVIIVSVLAAGIVLGYQHKQSSTFNVPHSVRAQVIAGHICTLEPDVNDRTGEVYAAWYCK